jgi:hypothetical protein
MNNICETRNKNRYSRIYLPVPPLNDFCASALTEREMKVAARAKACMAGGAKTEEVEDTGMLGSSSPVLYSSDRSRPEWRDPTVLAMKFARLPVGHRCPEGRGQALTEPQE